MSIEYTTNDATMSSSGEVVRRQRRVKSESRVTTSVDENGIQWDWDCEHESHATRAELLACLNATLDSE
jgi:hypothetical protein